MVILADECVDLQIVRRLREENHSVIYMPELGPGVTDEIVLAKANENRAVLLTADKDFGELVFRLGKANSGVLFYRLAGLGSEEKAEQICAAIRKHSEEMHNAFTVLTPAMLRIRRKNFS